MAGDEFMTREIEDAISCSILELSITDALDEYAEKVREDHAKIALSFITPDMHPDSLVKWVCEQIAAAIRQETNDE
jgi:hypothetical protein